MRLGFTVIYSFSPPSPLMPWKKWELQQFFVSYIELWGVNDCWRMYLIRRWQYLHFKWYCLGDWENCSCKSVCVRGWGKESDNICELSNGPETKIPYLKSSSTATWDRYYLPHLQWGQEGTEAYWYWQTGVRLLCLVNGGAGIKI